MGKMAMGRGVIILCLLPVVLGLPPSPRQFAPDLSSTAQLPGLPASNVYDSESVGAMDREMEHLPDPVERPRAPVRLLAERQPETPAAPPANPERAVVKNHGYEEPLTEAQLPPGTEMRDVFTPQMIQARAYSQPSSPETTPPESSMRRPEAPRNPYAPNPPPSNREEMKADDDASFEDDCDSPQIGELDVQESVKLTMNAAGAESMGTGTEQGQDTREVLPDAPTYKAASDDDAVVKNHGYEEPLTEAQLPPGTEMRDVFTPQTIQARAYSQPSSPETTPPES